MRHRQRAGLIRLQGNLLSEHDVARDQMTNGHKTPANFGATSGVDLMYVRHGAVANTIRFPVPQPMTSKYRLASNWVRCSDDSQFLRRRRPRASRLFSLKNILDSPRRARRRERASTGNRRNKNMTLRPISRRQAAGRTMFLLRLDRTTEFGRLHRGRCGRPQ